MLYEQEKSRLCSPYRTLCKLYLCRARLTPEEASTHKQKAVTILIALCLGKSLSTVETAEDETAAARDKFYHIGTELLEDVDAKAAASGFEHLLPDFCVVWISCHAWFLFLTQSTWAGAAVIEDVLVKISTALSPVFAALCKYREVE